MKNRREELLETLKTIEEKLEEVNGIKSFLEFSKKMLLSELGDTEEETKEVKPAFQFKA